MAKWILDPAHTVAAFHVRHMMVSNVHGQFNGLTGTIEFEPSEPATAKVDIEMETASIWTGVKNRDDHLRSPDFCQCEAHPRITFRSTGVEPTGSNRAKVTGDLTIRGVTRPVVFTAEWFGPVVYVDEEGTSTTMGFYATAEIDRDAYGMRWNVPLTSGGWMVGRYVKLTINAEGDLQAGDG